MQRRSPIDALRAKCLHLKGKAMNLERATLPRFVAFFGPDGAGKTTHVQLLASFYRANGWEVRKAWIRANHAMACVLSKLLVRLGYYRVEPGPIRRINQNDPWGRAFNVSTLPSLGRLWPWIEFLSLVPLIVRRAYVPLLLDRAVIAERYVVDSVVTISYILSDDSFLRSRLCRILLRMIPEGALLIYLRADYECILTRRGEEAHGPANIEHQLREYDKLAAQLRCPVISTNDKTVDETQKAIRRLVVEHPARRRLR